MRLDLYCEQTGQSQAAGGFANMALQLYLEGVSCSGDRAEMEGKSCEGHSVGSLVGDSDRGYAS